ncbi:unnamed protein product [Arctia plantaginis]|uniref:Uncharacterized protein n=1 Tax=Arctia plantaginis TaxID=874455 RepID=A0A8S1BG43_ARCPL|nr:unnamed protein product [Arctia plantaginis]
MGKQKPSAILTNVTQWIRVTDDTPVRSLRAGIMDSQRDKQCTQSFDDNGSRESEVLTATDTSNLVDVMEKVNTMILEKLSALVSKTLVEIRDTIRVLALENSKLTQKLQEANKKCVSYEQEINTLKSEMQTNKESNISSMKTPLLFRPVVSEPRSKAFQTPPSGRDKVDQHHETPKIELQ